MSKSVEPSNKILRAAVSGLLGLSATACAEAANEEEADPNPHEEHGECGDGDGDGDAGGHVNGDGDAGVDAGGDEEVEKEISTIDVQHTFAELSAMCDEREGYIQTHGSCSGVNTCRGFTYGDWGEEAQLVEHSCSGVNGCAGLTCVVAEEEPASGGLSGEEVMKLDDDFWTERGGQYGPKACKTCHVPSEYDDTLEEYVYDFTRLRLLFWPDSGRDAMNWTERSANVQERMIALGVQGLTEEGIHYSNMAAYNKILSKGEMKRVVAYMRDFDPADILAEEIKPHPGEEE